MLGQEEKGGSQSGKEGGREGEGGRREKVRELELYTLREFKGGKRRKGEKR